MDNRYRTVKTVVPGGGMASSDMHEFLPINDGKTALLTVYQQRQFDMSLWNVKTGMGWLMESIFQEVDVETNEVLFEWKSLDHVDPTVSYTYPGHTDTSGTGLDPRSPWDYFHINSIDKNQEGDYLISSRHTSAIYKISGQNGSVIWQLHGANPSFTNINFSFSQQHDARFLNENSTHTLLSLYNNGFNGFNKTHEYSSGMLILIDHVAKTATQLHEYAPLNNNMLSSSQGNMQVLPNHNVFIGWGNNAYISEHDQNGNLLLWGYIDKDRIMNYRAQKFQWDGMPTDVPALWTYSRSTEPFSSLTLYVSWNGATRVRYWRFYGAMNMTGPYALLNQVTKKGFETSYTFPHYYPWTYAEAVDLEGKVLGKSRHKFTFTPSRELQQYCANDMCENAQAYGLPGEEGASAFIPPLGLTTVPWVDPENPEAHYDWGESSEPASQPLDEAKETLKIAYGEPFFYSRPQVKDIETNYGGVPRSRMVCPCAGGWCCRDWGLHGGSKVSTATPSCLPGERAQIIRTIGRCYRRTKTAGRDERHAVVALAAMDRSIRRTTLFPLEGARFEQERRCILGLGFHSLTPYITLSYFIVN